jgi:hypothetical protein
VVEENNQPPVTYGKKFVHIKWNSRKYRINLFLTKLHLQLFNLILGICQKKGNLILGNDLVFHYFLRIFIFLVIYLCLYIIFQVGWAGSTALYELAVFDPFEIFLLHKI